MSGLNGGNDALGAGEVFKGIYRLVVGDRNIFRSAGVVEPGVFRPDAGIVQTEMCIRDSLATADI